MGKLVATEITSWHVIFEENFQVWNPDGSEPWSITRHLIRNISFFSGPLTLFPINEKLHVYLFNCKGFRETEKKN